MARMAFQTAGENGDHKSIAELVKELTEEVSTLARQEIHLAKVELAQKGKVAGAGAGLLGLAGGLGLLAGAAFTAGVIVTLSLVMPLSVAAFGVAIVYGVVGTVIAVAGIARIKSAASPPQETMESVQEDVRWLKRRIK